jgi:glutathione peroxidase|tara:strand:- start:1210 stop:1767 length:558 start_codon:yes stop_codon:yes gene_type:complete
MFNKNYITIILITIMFSFFEKVNAQYDKLFFDLNIKGITGDNLNLAEYKGKTILLVNVASKCGFTKQYTDLQSLYDKYKDRDFLVIAVPSNQFGNQEPGTNEEILNFCETNFNISFPITDKVDVKGDNAHPLYKWAKVNHGNGTIPKWNFHKILINKNGKIEETYGSFINPMSKKIIVKIEEILK